MYIKLLSLLLLVPMSFPLQGQQSPIYTDLFSSYFNNLSLINPSFIPLEGKMNFIANYKNRTGPFQKIASYSFTSARYIRKENNGVHAVRGIFWNEKEGPYIQKPRGYVNYAYLLSLSEHTSLSAGVAMGFAQIAFSAPSATGTGTAMLPDGAVGLTLRGKNVGIAVSSMQLFNTGSKAISAVIQLRRHYNFFLSSEKELSPVWKMRGYLLYRLLPEVNDNADATLLLDYKNVFSLGSSARYKQGLSFFIAFNMNVGKDGLLISFAYNSPVLGKNNVLNSLELTSGYTVR